MPMLAYRPVLYLRHGYDQRIGPDYSHYRPRMSEQDDLALQRRKYSDPFRRKMGMSFLLKTLSAALLFALGIGLARADSLVDTLTINATIPLSKQSCFYADQFNGTSYSDTKLCSGWATAIGALSATNNLADLTSLSTARANLGLGSAAISSTGTSGATIPVLNGANAWCGVQSFSSGDFVLKGATSGSTTVNAAAAASGMLTLPAATDTLTANATAATVTNKTINCANNTCTVRLANDVTGNLPVTNLNGGNSASASTFWRGDETWAIPAGFGNVIGPSTAVSTDLASYNGTTGTVIQDSGIATASVATPAGGQTLTNKTINCANNTCTVRLANDVTGNLPVTNLSGGNSASVSTFWRGDGTWAIPAGSGNVTGPNSSVSGDIATFSGASGMALQDTGTQLSALAPLASPSFTRTPVAPTATNTAQIATTAYVQNQAYAALASPTLSGTPTAPTPAQGTNSTQIATTAFVKSQQIPISIGWIAGQNPDNAIASVINKAMTVNAIVGAVEVANGSTATVAVNHAPIGVACSAGTALHSGSLDANGTAATDQTLTVTTASLAVGDRICLQTTGGSNWNSSRLSAPSPSL
jgi:hypothetical protein